MTTENTLTTSKWKKSELYIFRISFVFFTLLSIPLSIKYYKMLTNINWLNLGYRDLTNIGRFSPDILTISTESGKWGIASYADYGLLLIIAIAVASVWTFFDRSRLNYKILYYWLRVLVRYRVAIGMIEFGYVKVFLVQMPEAPLGTLNTNFGDITAQKLYWLSVGVVPWYEITLGMVEVIAGILLFFRKTILPGAILTAVASANIVYINFSFDGGVHVYSSYFVILCAFLIVPYLKDYYNLLIVQKAVTPVRYYPSFKNSTQNTIKAVLKWTIISVFVPYMAYLHIQNRLHKPLIKEPITAGIPYSNGYYEVTEFKLNNQSIPYSPNDSLRWQDATFEKYSTITFKVNKAIQIDLANGTPAKKDIDRNWELTGISGGRQYYYYEEDSLNRNIIRLYSKHIHAVKSNKQGKAQDKEVKIPNFVFEINKTNENRIILKGINDKKDSIYVKLDKINRTYALRNEQ